MTAQELEAASLRLVEGGVLDRILRLLRHQWDRVPRETILNVVRDSATEVVRRRRGGQVITNVPGLITTIARRMLARVWTALQEAEGARSAIELQAVHPEVWRHDQEQVATVERAAVYVRTLVPRLDNENHRRTIYALLDAAQQGRQLQNKDLAEQLGCSPDTAGQILSDWTGAMALDQTSFAGFCASPEPHRDWTQTRSKIGWRCCNAAFTRTATDERRPAGRRP